MRRIKNKTVFCLITLFLFGCQTDSHTRFKAKTKLSSSINATVLALSKGLPSGYRRPFEKTIIHYGKFARDKLFSSTIWKEKFDTLDSFSMIELFRFSDGLLTGYVTTSNSDIINYDYYAMSPSHNRSKEVFQVTYIHENEILRVERMVANAFKIGISNCTDSYMPVVAYKVHKTKNEGIVDVAFSCN